MRRPLEALERRIVGVLIEKLLSTPQYYPLTVNSLTTGCNQKNNRDPEMDVSDDDVLRSLMTLQRDGLVVLVRSESSRVDKWRIAPLEKLGLEREKQMAVFAELLLRGPQTKAELRARASRMRHEIDAAEIDGILDGFCAREEPLAVNIGRAPGGRAERYAHTLHDPEELEALRQASAAGAPRPAPAAAALPPGRPSEPAAPSAIVDELNAKLSRALEEIDALRARVDALEQGIASLRGEGP